MATPCLVHFSSGKVYSPRGADISVYVHWDGYPDGASGMYASLRLFVSELEVYSGRQQVKNSLPTEIASKFIVFLSRRYTIEADTTYLDFSSPYVVDWREYDVAYEYYFDCRTLLFICKKNV